MADWAAFAGFTGVVLGLLLLLAHASQSVFTDQPTDERPPSTTDTGRTGDGVDDISADTDVDGTTADDGTDRREITDDSLATIDPTADGGVDSAAGPRHRLFDDGTTRRFGDDRDSARRGASPSDSDDVDPASEYSTATLLVNVAFSQGLFGGLLLLAAWYTQIPLSAFGVSAETVGPVPLTIGVAVGVGLYAFNEVGAAVGDRFGITSSEELRAALAPDTLVGWAVLLLLVLPLIAGFEEFLFRAALIGALSSGFAISPWLLAGFSSVAFALGHGAQGPGGILVTGVLGFVLASAFVLTGSFLVVVVAHYLVNALEFVVHEGLGVDWFGE